MKRYEKFSYDISLYGEDDSLRKTAFAGVCWSEILDRLEKDHSPVLLENTNRIKLIKGEVKFICYE
jgi:hypothetical protein